MQNQRVGKQHSRFLEQEDTRRLVIFFSALNQLQASPTIFQVLGKASRRELGFPLMQIPSNIKLEERSW